MERFLIFTNPDKDIDLKLSMDLLAYIDENGASAVVVSDEINKGIRYAAACGSFLGYKCEDGLLTKEQLGKVEAVIVLGGDGTMLRAAHYIGEYDAPLMGINLGTLGFLAEVEAVHAKKAIRRLLTGDFGIEERMMIEGNIGGKSFNSLNDIVITRAGFSRVIALNIYVNDQLLETYDADGVIVSTPTGSTGYSLSAGGPIVSPKSKVILVTPISPHSLTSKSVVFDSQDVIKVEIVKKRKTQETEAIVSFDGGDNIELSAGDVITVSKSSIKTDFIKMYDVNFYSVLKSKIGG